jgi:hypothetical protein
MKVSIQMAQMTGRNSEQGKIFISVINKQEHSWTRVMKTMSWIPSIFFQFLYYLQIILHLLRYDILLSDYTYYESCHHFHMKVDSALSAETLLPTY